MSKYDIRVSARRLRVRGISIVKIAKDLNVSKSSVSSWCRDIVLTEEQYEKLNNNKGTSLSTGRRMGVEANRNKKLKAINDAEVIGKKIISNISKRELLMIATALYWSEGSKSDTTSSWMFVNSDPKMVLLMKNFLISVIGVYPGDIMCRIQINQIHKPRIETVLNFWKNLLKLEDNQVKRPYFVSTKAHKVYENYNDYFGVCRLFVKKSKNLQYRMRGLIKAMKENILSA